MRENVHRKKHPSISIRGQENSVSIFFTFLPFVTNQQTNRQNICRIDAHIWEKCFSKVIAIGMQGLDNWITRPFGHMAWPHKPSKNLKKTAKIVNFCHVWQLLAAKQLTVQPSSAHLLNWLGLGNKSLGMALFYMGSICPVFWGICISSPLLGTAIVYFSFKV